MGEIGLEALMAGLNNAWNGTTEWNRRDLAETY